MCNSIGGLDMIDEKKIEEAAIENSEKLSDGKHYRDLVVGFKAGARWAINELLKDLWHPASEEPNIKQGECCVTCLVKFKNGSTELCVYFRNPEGWVCNDMSPKDFKRNFKEWLYIDNLFPKGRRREMKENKHSLKISRSFFGDTTLDGYPIVTYSNDELKILKNLLTRVLGEVNEYIKD